MATKARAVRVVAGGSSSEADDTGSPGAVMVTASLPVCPEGNLDKYYQVLYIAKEARNENT